MGAIWNEMWMSYRHAALIRKRRHEIMLNFDMEKFLFEVPWFDILKVCVKTGEWDVIFDLDVWRKVSYKRKSTALYETK